ncbi:NADAR family protein [Gynuella sp.]|uniref:NADAR family protein n=1 Tax=Gynuella sp. TaxID=2969146 RepID=UPI003D0AC63A
MDIKNQAQLIDYVNHGDKVKYVFFWGHQKPSSGVSKTCFSQWYESAFEVDGMRYPTAEHFMMAGKARLFGDHAAAQRILDSDNPGEVKRIGRSIQGFDEQRWVEHRFNIVVEGNLAKFRQNKALGDFLLSTKQRVLVEASPVDRIWGIGLAADHPEAENPNLWKGLNLLGFALMEVRNQLLRCELCS